MSLWKRQIATLVADPDVDPEVLNKMRVDKQAADDAAPLQSLKDTPKQMSVIAENLYGCLSEYDTPTKLGVVSCLCALVQLEEAGILSNPVDWNTGVKLALTALTISQTVKERKGHAVDPD